MKQYLSGLFLLFSLCTLAQKTAVLGEKDSLYYGYRTGGSLTTIDKENSFYATTMPGGPFSRDENTLQYNFFLNTVGGARAYSWNPWNKMRFSGMPHLGFSYQFGSIGTQYVNVKYTHALPHNLVMNIDYDMLKSKGYYRNSDVGKHDVQLRLQREAAVYSFSLKSQFNGQNTQYNDGLVDSSLVESFGIGFIPVRKTQTHVKNKGFRIELEHYIDFLAKDSINATGLYVDNGLKVRNHRYIEPSGDFSSDYGIPFIATDSTLDQHQLGEWLTGAGLYYHRSNFIIKAGIANTFWQYANLGNLIRQNELNLDAKLKYSNRFFTFENHTNFNLIGANREWFTLSKAKVLLKQFTLNGMVNIENLLPEPYQRVYTGNFIQYNTPLSALKNQWKLETVIDANYELKNMRVKAFFNSALMKNMYWFENGQWEISNQDQYNSLQFGIDYKAQFKWFVLGTKAMYGSASWMPDFYGNLRLAANGRMFKSKKLLGQIGVEGSYLTKYELVNFTPMMEYYRYQAGLGTSPARFNLHVFGALEIQTFRFFFRVENLGAMFNAKESQVMQGYLISPLHFRIGVTWDFFN